MSLLWASSGGVPMVLLNSAFIFRRSNLKPYNARKSLIVGPWADASWRSSAFITNSAFSGTASIICPV